MRKKEALAVRLHKYSRAGRDWRPGVAGVAPLEAEETRRAGRPEVEERGGAAASGVPEGREERLRAAWPEAQAMDHAARPEAGGRGGGDGRHSGGG